MGVFFGVFLNVTGKIKKLLKQRDPVYAKFADVEMVTGDKPFEDLIAQLEEKLKTYVKNS